MAISNYLAKIKSSGVYRYVFDKTDIPVSERSSIRLVVGYSEKGPFNTPVYISDAEDFILTFGNISRRMERKGIFFHRLALQALEAGPILALNLKPFKNETAKMISFNATDILCDGKLTVKATADSIELTPVTAYDSNGDEVNLSDAGIVARDFLTPVPDYSNTTRTVYKNADGDEVDATEALTNDVLNEGYTEETVIGDTLNEGYTEETVTDGYTFVSSRSEDAKFMRTIETVKINGVSQRVEVYWKSATGAIGASKDSGTFVAAHFTYNKKYFNDAYYKVTNDTIEITGLQADKTDDIMDDALIALDGTNVAGEKLNTIYNTNRFWKLTDNVMDISPMKSRAGQTSDYIRIVQTSSKEDSVTLFIRPVVPSGYNIKISDWYSSEVSETIPPYMEALRDHYLNEFFVEIYAFKGDLRKASLFEEGGTLGAWHGDTFYPFCKYENGVLRTNSDYVDAFGAPADALDAMADITTSNFINKYTGILFPTFKDANGNFISIDSVFNDEYSQHKCLMALDEALLDEAYEIDLDGNEVYDNTEENSVLSGNQKVTSTGISGLVHLLTSAVHAKTSGKGDDFANDYSAIAVPPVNASVVGYYLEGYNYTTILKNETGKTLVEDKIGAVLGYKGIYEALTNNVDVDYKYWIDTFQGYPGVSMKSNISAILKQKFNVLGILNFPPIHDCATFLGFPGLTGGFDMKNVTKSGSGITLPAEVQGASFVGFFTQLQMTDGTNKFIVPSAALVSNLFMEKRSKRLPYYAVAGVNYGRIQYPGVVGPDYNYSRPDLDALEPFGVNAIIYIPRKGIVINSNQTAKQSPVTALSKINIRELVTYLQDTVEDMLYNYQWELNSSTLRDAVRSKCETILGLIQANNGIYDYRVQCDEQNNTDAIIDAEMFVVDIEIEPGKPAGKMVQTLTLRRKGGIASTPRD
jgi:hypothetical protein